VVAEQSRLIEGIIKLCPTVRRNDDVEDAQKDRAKLDAAFSELEQKVRGAAKGAKFCHILGRR
jgi:hypothetical protein